MITISKDELCTVLCALRESAAAATQYGFMTPAHTPERAALLANAEVFSGLANRLMQREDARRERIVAHNESVFEDLSLEWLNQAFNEGDGVYRP
jgi:hypothetical protein